MRMAARVREAIGSKRKEDFSAREITLELGIEMGGSVRDVLQDMLRRGEIKRTGYGRYRFLGFSPRWSNRAAIKPRVHRAMHVKKSFTANDLARLSDATVNFVRKEMRKLVATGDLERVCIKQNNRFSREWVYRVRHPDRFYIKFCAKKSAKESTGGSHGSHQRTGQEVAETQSQDG